MNKWITGAWRLLHVRLFVYCLGLLGTRLAMGLRAGRVYYPAARLFCLLYRRLYNDCYSDRSLHPLEKACCSWYERSFKALVRQGTVNGNLFYEGFKQSRKARGYRRYFKSLPPEHGVRLRYPRDNDTPERQGDLMILKPWKGPREKGVIIIHYTESLAKFAALYDLPAIAARYRIVLEPSWWGYQDVYFLFFYALQTEVFIECPFEADYRFIETMDGNFRPTRLGAGDWVDPANFIDGKKEAKVYDIVMVGNWSKIKRHEILFRALSKMPGEMNPRVALIGYPSRGRTRQTIIDEAGKYNVADRLEIFERITPAQVGQILRKSKVNVLLSKGEGANRGIYEGLFSGNVLVVYAGNRGVNMQNINAYTGYVAFDDELAQVLAEAIANYERFHTAGWAAANTGCISSSKNLNRHIKAAAMERNEAWSEDIAFKKNLPNNMYAYAADLLRIAPEYDELKAFLLFKKLQSVQSRGGAGGQPEEYT